MTATCNGKNGVHPVTTASEAFAILLESVGHFDRWQWKLMLITGFCGVFTGLHNFAGVLLGGSPDHWCHIPSVNFNASYALEMQNETSPWIRGKDGNMVPSSCSYYSEIPVTTSNVTNECHEWFYEQSEFHSTIVTEYNLVCGKKWLLSTAQSTYMFGILAGAVIFSALSDRWGRRRVSLICSVIFFVTSVLVAFSASLSMFFILRFIVAAAGQGMFLVNYILLMECLGLKGRTVLGNLFHLSFAVGFTLLALIGYFYRDWRDLQLFISAPSLLLLSYYWVLPESPRWLMTQHRYEEAVEILENIGKFNDKTLPPEDKLKELIGIIKIEGDAPVESETLLQKLKLTWQSIVTLVQTPNMRRRNLIAFYAWFVTSMMYYGLTFNGANIDASAYVSVFFSGAVEFPAIVFTITSLLWFGRRSTLCFSMTLSGIACVAIAFVPRNLVALNISLSTIGKGLSTASFYLVFMFSAELVPTNVRNMSIGMASLFGRFGSAISPFIVDLLGNIYYAIPSTVFGVAALIAGLLISFLPETGNKKLPESVQEIEAMKR